MIFVEVSCSLGNEAKEVPIYVEVFVERFQLPSQSKSRFNIISSPNLLGFDVVNEIGETQMLKDTKFGCLPITFSGCGKIWN